LANPPCSLLLDEAVRRIERANVDERHRLARRIAKDDADSEARLRDEAQRRPCRPDPEHRPAASLRPVCLVKGSEDSRLAAAADE
jgi:hypothetical protein